MSIEQYPKPVFETGAGDALDGPAPTVSNALAASQGHEGAGPSSAPQIVAADSLHGMTTTSAENKTAANCNCAPQAMYIHHPYAGSHGAPAGGQGHQFPVHYTVPPPPNHPTRPPAGSYDPFEPFVNSASDCCTPKLSCLGPDGRCLPPWEWKKMDPLRPNSTYKILDCTIQ